MNRIFEYKDYRRLIKDTLDSERFGRGSQAQLADHLNVKSSFISQVISGKQDFNLESAYKTAEFLGLNPIETRFFLLLIQLERAGTVELRRHFQEQIDEVLVQQNKIQSHVSREQKVLSDEDMLDYYSSWHTIAIHLAVRNPEIKDQSDLSKLLGIEPRQVRESLALLERLKFIEREKNGWKTTNQSFHFGKDSLALKNHHKNWRLEAIRSLQGQDPKDIHYSAVLSIDEKAASEIRNILLKSISACDPHIKEAADKKVHALTIDFFPLKSGS